VEQRTGTSNRIRGLLSESGIVLPLKAATQGGRSVPAQPAGVVAWVLPRRSEDFVLPA
jgi:hypothetical protein